MGIVAGLVGGAAGFARGAPTAPASSAQPPLVTAKLVLGAAEIAPGAQFPVGILFDIERGWHIYWINPGDSGLATRVKFSAPGRFTVGPLLWPTPQEFDQPGGLRGFGYEDSVMLSALVQAPARLEGSAPAAVRADVGWLACAAICVHGRATLEAKLPVGRRFQPANSALFTEWGQRWPAPPGAADLPFTVQTSRGPQSRVTLQLNWRGPPPARIQWFPGADPAVEVGPQSVTTEGNVTRIEFDARVLAGQQPEGERSPGVVAWTDRDGRRRGAWLDISYK